MRETPPPGPVGVISHPCGWRLGGEPHRHSFCNAATCGCQARPHSTAHHPWPDVEWPAGVGLEVRLSRLAAVNFGRIGVRARPAVPRDPSRRRRPRPGDRQRRHRGRAGSDEARGAPLLPRQHAPERAGLRRAHDRQSPPASEADERRRHRRPCRGRKGRLAPAQAPRSGQRGHRASGMGLPARRLSGPERHRPPERHLPRLRGVGRAGDDPPGGAGAPCETALRRAPPPAHARRPPGRRHRAGSLRLRHGLCGLAVEPPGRRPVLRGGPARAP